MTLQDAVSERKRIVSNYYKAGKYYYLVNKSSYIIVTLIRDKLLLIFITCNCDSLLTICTLA